MSEHSRFHLTQMETALRRRGLSNTVLDDDGSSNFWLDVETDRHLLVFRWLDDGFLIDVSDHEGNAVMQIERAALDDALAILADKGVLPAQS